MEALSSVYVIKVNETDKAKPIRDNIQKSLDKYKKNGDRFDDKTIYYPVKDDHLSPDNDIQYVMFIEHINTGKIEFVNKKDIDTCEIEKVFLGRGQLCLNTKENANYRFILKHCIHCYFTDPYVMANLLDDIDLRHDFESDSFIKKVKIKSLIEKIEGIFFSNDFIITSQNGSPNLHETKSNPSYTANEYATQISHRDLKVSDSEFRTPFQRDRERIVNSRAFRRLVDKTQIFNADKGDHYRTRMTHTLEVNQIAKAIALALGLNLDLTEAIALGHDIGHTPFGHEGERTLNKLLHDEFKQFNIIDTRSEKEKENNPFILGGFKHNIHGVRVLTQLEEKYVDHLGLNISVEVLEGILKHTKFDSIDVKNLFSERLVQNLHIDTPFPVNYEGQTVAIADEIAQRGHDIDDAISSGLISSEEVLEFLEAKTCEKLCSELKKELRHINEGQRIYINKQQLIANRFVSTLIHYFINDVIAASNDSLSNGSRGKKISFSDTGSDVCKYLEKIVTKRVINNSEVSGFDHHGGIIIRKLFFSYYNNPRLLHHGSLRRYYYSVLTHPCSLVSENAIDISDANLDVLNHEIECLTKHEIIISDGYKHNNPIFEKRKLLIRCITDYIAGMTDSYAMKEYERLR